jgi:putative glutamine amidotransferase
MSNSGRPLIGIPCRSDSSMIYKGRPTDAQSSSYISAIISAGGAPFLIPIEARDDVLRILFEQADAILLPGGGDIAPQFLGGTPHPSLSDVQPSDLFKTQALVESGTPHPSLSDVQPARDELELTLARWGLEAGKPLLGICRGIQVMNVAAGGSLYQDIASQCPDAGRHDYFSGSNYPRDFLAHPVAIEPGSRLGAVLSVDHLSVNSLHHQALKEVPPPYRVVARSPDGVVEGIEVPHHPFAIGVQWHPEELVANQEAARCLFLAFVAAYRNGRAGS